MSSTNFTVPRGVKKIDCFCVGGGGGVNSSNKNGGSSSIGSICSANGGFGGSNTDCGFGGCNGGNGGSGGAGGFDFSLLDVIHTYEVGGFGGGSDGSDGQNPFICDRGDSKKIIKSFGGAGQHSTTRYFGESTGTLYSTGGGASTNGSFNSGNGCGGSKIAKRGFGYGGGGYTKTSLEQSVTPGSNIAVTIGSGGVSGKLSDGDSGIAIIRWGK